MPEQPSWPAGEAADTRSGVGQLASAALAAPTPAPEAERASEERVLRHFRTHDLPPRRLHELPPVRSRLSWAERLARALRCLRGQ